MLDDAFILRVERLRDAAEDLKKTLRTTYSSASSQVRSERVRDEARRIAEVWMVEIAVRSDVRSALDPETIADYSIEFQRLLTYSERASLRRKYDAALTAILRDFRARVVVPLKQRRGTSAGAPVPTTTSRPASKALDQLGSLFVGHSFAPEDRQVVDPILRLFKVFGIEVTTGEKPKADLVSAKIRKRIEDADGFVGVFTRRDKFSGKAEWATSTWVIDEKAFALAKDKKLILIKEQGVSSIGGLQGDYEYLDFTRDNLVDLVLRLMELFVTPEE